MLNNKPIFLWPFIWVYRIVALVIKFPILFVRYFCLGFFFTTSFFIEQFINLFSWAFKYCFLGLMFLSYIVYTSVKIVTKLLFKFVKYFILGLGFPFVALFKAYNDEAAKEKRNVVKKQKQAEKEELKHQQELKLQEVENKKTQQKQLKEAQQALAEKKKQEMLTIKQEQETKKQQEKLEKQELARKQKEEALALKKEAKEKAKQEKLEKQELARKQKEEALALKKEAKEKVKQEKLEKRELVRKQKEEALALKKEAKEKAKQEKLEKQELVRKQKEEALALKKEAKEKAKQEKLEKQNKDKEVEYTIHAPQNEILNDEKNDELRQNRLLTKEERRQLKLEKKAQKKAEKEARRLEKLNKPKLTKKEKRELKLEREAARKEEKIKRAEEKKRKQENDIYINENVKLEKVPFSKKLSDSLKQLNELPNRIMQRLHKEWNELSFVKHARNEKAMDKQALLINFDGEDAVKSDKKVVYEYIAKNTDGKIIKGYFEAFSKVEVHSFLLSEGYEVYSIKTNRLIQLLHTPTGTGKTKIKIKDLIFFLTQLSTYIKAGIPLVEALKILSRQYKNKNYQRIFSALVYDLTMGENFSDALAKQGNAFPRLLINMVKASEMTGELPEALDDMAEYYTETDKTRKQMVTAMMYPSIIFVISIAAVTFIMVFVVPKFVDIYASMEDARLPWITQFIVNLSAFLEKNLVMILVAVVVIVAVLVYIYKKVKIFRTVVQYIVMHIPVFGNVIIYNEITMFTKTFCSLLRHNVFITDSMEILNKITTNEVYKMIILDTITNLARGEKISLAFKDHWAVPMPAYEMIVTGERTGQLPEMMGKVSAYYQEMHKNAVTRIKTFVEPALILFLTVIVGGIVLSIIVPMFDMYNNMGL